MNKRTYSAVMGGNSDNNIRFADFRGLILDFGFSERIRGDHFIYKEMTLWKGLLYNQKEIKQKHIR